MKFRSVHDVSVNKGFGMSEISVSRVGTLFAATLTILGIVTAFAELGYYALELPHIRVTPDLRPRLLNDIAHDMTR